MLRDGAELGDAYSHDKQELQDMQQVMVQQQASRQTVVFQRQGIKSFKRHGERHVCPGENITRSESSLATVF